MSNEPDHLDPKEATEAKLCAYLEGELSTEDRVDIEKHLKSNPQHRQLLIDLAETREWMRTIPREAAPPELAEAFAAQLERSMLLDSGVDHSGSAINHLPQYALLAAIVLLTLGLGVLIAVMLRGGGPGYTIAPRVPTPGRLAGVANSPTSNPVSDRLASDAPKKAGVALQPKSPVVPSVAVTSAADTGGAAISTGHRNLFATSPIPAKVPQMGGALTRAEDAMRARVVSDHRRTIGLIVSTPNPSSTADQIRRFFTGNQIAFDQEPPAALEFRNTNYGLPAPGAANAPAMGNGLAGIAQNAMPRQFTAQNNGVAQAQIAPRQQRSAGSQILTTAPTGRFDKQAETNNSDQLIYVGRALTPLQVELLRGTLGTGGIDQTVKRLDLSQSAASEKPAAPEAATTGLITKGQSLTVTVPQLVGPGIEKTNLVKVADDGTINLPMLDPLAAAGTSRAELQTRIAAKYREANLIPAATVTVVVNAPATQPATRPSSVTAAPTTMPAASQPTAITTATTQPAMVDDKVDVVVYVQQAQ